MKKQTRNEMLKMLISSIVAALFTLGVYLYLSNHEKNVEIEGSATILYHDIEHSTTVLDLAINQTGIGQVMNNPHSNLVKDRDFRKLIIDLRSKLDSKQIKKLLIYYGNLEQLENARVEYWLGRDENEVNQAYENYRILLEIVYKQPTEQEFIDAFEEVKKLSSFNGDN